MSITDRDLLFLTAQGTDSLSPRNPILPSRPTIDPASTFRIGEEAIELKEDPLGMTRRAESLGAAREHDESLLGPVGTPDSGSASQSSMRLPNQGEAAARIAAVDKLLDDVLDDRREIAIGPLKALLVFRHEPLEMMEQQPVENRAFWMTRTVDSRHGGRDNAGNGPTSRI